jgi:cytochrome c-type biogenesis protein CcmE
LSVLGSNELTVEDAVPELAPRSSKKRNRRLLFAGLLIVAAIGYVLYEGLGNALDYYLPVNQAISQKAELGTSSFRIEGRVVPGTVKRLPGGSSFSITAGGKTEKVRDWGDAPQLFAPGKRVILVGHFVGNRFDATQIMVKHSSDYLPAPTVKKAEAGHVAKRAAVRS